jgi:hypothetical protein
MILKAKKIFRLSNSKLRRLIMNGKKLTLILLSLFIPLFSFAQTAWNPKAPSAKLSSVKAFFERPIEKVKADILAQKPEIDSYFETKFGGNLILSEAAVGGTTEILEFLLKNGSKTEYIDKRSYSTALYDAVIARRLDSIKILLKYGANPDYKFIDKPIDRCVDGYITF